MKLSEVRPCDSCGGPIVATFNVVRMSLAVFNPQVANQVLGLMGYFQGSLRLADVFAPETEAVTVAMDQPEHRELMVELFICHACYARPLVLGELAERRVKAMVKKSEEQGGQP